MPTRQLWLIIVIASLLGLAVFDGSRRYENSRADRIAADLLERVYVRALREYYDFLAEVRRQEQRRQQADLQQKSAQSSPSSIPSLPESSNELPVSDLDVSRSVMSFYVIEQSEDAPVRSTDWQVQQSLDSLSGKLISPLESQENADILLSLATAFRQINYRVEVAAWIAAIAGDIGFDNLTIRLEQRDIQLNPSDRDRYLAFPDFIAADLILYLDATPIRERFRTPFFALMTGITLGLFVFILLFLVSVNYYKRGRAEQERDQSLSHAEGLSNQLVKAQQHVQSADQLASLGQISAGIAHEVNNPLAYIESNLVGLQDDIEAMVDYIEYANTMTSAVVTAETGHRLRRHYERLGLDSCMEFASDRVQDCMEGVARVDQIVRDMQKLTRRSSGTKRVCNINSDLNSVINIARTRLPNNISLEVNLIDCPDMYCSPSQIGQVVMNLLVNAMHAISSKQGLINIDQRLEGEQLLISVADNGPGMSQEIAERVFEPFFTTKPVGQGTGMGLSLCYKLISEHQGDIQLHTTLGQGSCFTIVLPIGAREELHVTD